MLLIAHSAALAHVKHIKEGHPFSEDYFRDLIEHCSFRAMELIHNGVVDTRLGARVHEYCLKCPHAQGYARPIPSTISCLYVQSSWTLCVWCCCLGCFSTSSPPSAPSSLPAPRGRTHRSSPRQRTSCSSEVRLNWKYNLVLIVLFW